MPRTPRSRTSSLGLADRTVTGARRLCPRARAHTPGQKARQSMVARPPSIYLTGTSSRSEPESLMSRREERTNFWDAVFCNRPPSLRDGEDRSRRSGNGSRIEPVKMFGAVRGSPSRVTKARSVEIVPASVRIVKLSTSYFFGGEFLSPSEVRSLDFRGHKEVRRRLSVAHVPQR